MKPVADGMVADYDVTLPADHSLLLSKSAVTFVPEGRQGNNCLAAWWWTQAVQRAFSLPHFRCWKIVLSVSE